MQAKRTLVVLACGGVLALAAGVSAAQSGAWPNRPIRLVVPLPPGGSPDYLSRLLAERLQPVLGQPLGVQALDRLDDPRVEHSPPLVEQAPVGHLEGEGMPERVFGFGEQARLVQELGGLEASQ